MLPNRIYIKNEIVIIKEINDAASKEQEKSFWRLYFFVEEQGKAQKDHAVRSDNKESSSYILIGTGQFAPNYQYINYQPISANVAGTSYAYLKLVFESRLPACKLHTSHGRYKLTINKNITTIPAPEFSKPIDQEQNLDGSKLYMQLSSESLINQLSLNSQESSKRLLDQSEEFSGNKKQKIAETTPESDSFFTLHALNANPHYFRGRNILFAWQKKLDEFKKLCYEFEGLGIYRENGELSRKVVEIETMINTFKERFRKIPEICKTAVAFHYKGNAGSGIKIYPADGVTFSALEAILQSGKLPQDLFPKKCDKRPTRLKKSDYLKCLAMPENNTEPVDSDIIFPLQTKSTSHILSTLFNINRQENLNIHNNSNSNDKSVHGYSAITPPSNLTNNKQNVIFIPDEFVRYLARQGLYKNNKPMELLSGATLSPLIDIENNSIFKKTSFKKI